MPQGRQNLWVMETPESLIVASKEGFIAQYKVQNGELYYRPKTRAGWIQLSPEQMMQHLAINTVVGEWLRSRKHAAPLVETFRRTGTNQIL
jgi:hypothetical protein